MTVRCLRGWWSQCPIHTLRITDHSMMTSSNGIFFASLALCAGNSPVTGEFPSQEPVTLSFDVFFDLYLNKRLSKAPRRRWFETGSLWRHCSELVKSTSCLNSTGSTLYSEGSFVRRFFSPKPFEVAMVWRTYGPKVLYSEVPLLRKLSCSDGSIFRKALHYMDSMLRRFFSPKFI